MGREGIIPWIRLGHSKFIQRSWIIILVISLGIGTYISQNLFIPLQLNKQPSQQLRWLCSPQICPLQQGDTILDLKQESFKILNTQLWPIGHTLSPSQMNLNQMLEAMHVWHSLPHWDKNFIAMSYYYKKEETKTISIKGLYNNLPASWDSLIRWKRRYDSTLDFKADLELKTKLMYLSDSELREIKIQHVWLEVISLDGSQKKTIIPLDSVQGSLY